ncbi:hypothetical protein EYF80_019589 [Liparis tanakae]|uniref:Uncharacterized protein n=1 Tax=Liparis tanakae TaxID=230148 RepID=A0A4Z2HX08_9TELE|nr:hypothetical protein EYF80_019589 [Liparis tanakae]
MSENHRQGSLYASDELKREKNRDLGGSGGSGEHSMKKQSVSVTPAFTHYLLDFICATPRPSTSSLPFNCRHKKKL